MGRIGLAKAKEVIMVEYPQLQFLDNVPTVVEITKAEPWSGNGKYGTYHKYPIKHNNQAMCFFATDLLNSLLQSIPIKKGTVAKITKKQREDDPQKKFWIVEVDRATYSSDNLQNMVLNEPKQEIVPEEKHTIDDYVRTIITIYGKVQRLAESKEIQTEPGDIEKLAVSVFIQCCRDGLAMFNGDARSYEDLPF